MPKKKNEKEKKINTKKQILKVSGTKDIVLEEYQYWDLIIRKADKLARDYSFQRVKLPILEKIELFQKITGQDTEIVSKELYNFIDKDGEKIALRPESTPGLIRAYIENKMWKKDLVSRIFWLGPLFRFNKPKFGSKRQFNQFALDIIGSDSPSADAQLILLAYNFFKELQVDVQIQINSIGCENENCRPIYLEQLLEFYRERGKKSKLCNNCKKNIDKNPLLLLDCKEIECLEIREGAPPTVNHLCEACKNHFFKVIEYLDELEIPYSLNTYLSRGLSYYDRTVFEIWDKNEIEDFENNKKKHPISLCGGGRYNSLVEKMGGESTPACGFAVGLERTVAKIKNNENVLISEKKNNLIFIAQTGDQGRKKAFILFEEIRRAGYEVRQSFVKDSLKEQLKDAEEIDATITLILGQKEALEETIMIRDMESGNQEVIDYKKIYFELDKRLNEKK